MQDLQGLYQKLERRRKELGLTQAQVGQRAFGRADNSALQNIRRGAWPSADRLSALCSVLGLNMSLDETGQNATKGTMDKSNFCAKDRLPLIGIAACSAQGWAGETRLAADLPRPEWIGATPAFWAKARGSSMVPEGINDGDYCVVGCEQTVRVGDRVWVREASVERRVAVKRLIDIADQVVTLRGWLPPVGGHQEAFEEVRHTSAILELLPVIGVYRGNLEGHERTCRFVDDPKDHTRTKNSGSDTVEIPALHDVGAKPDSVADSAAFPRKWILQLGVSADSLCVATVTDASLEPKISQHSAVLVDTADHSLGQSGIFAIRTDGTVRIAYVEDLGNGSFFIKGDGKRSASIVVAHNDPGFAAIGRVVWVGQRVT